MGTDLVRHKDRWASGVKGLRDVFVRLENEGFPLEAQRVSLGQGVPIHLFQAAWLFEKG